MHYKRKIKEKKEGVKMNDFMTFINTCGFPIAMCGVLAYYISTLTKSHKEETEKFTSALNSNTIVLQKLCDKLDVEREELNE